MGWLQVITNRLEFPPVRRIRWFNLALLVTTSALALYGMLYVPRDYRTLIFAVAYYVFSMLGITAGYHRLWSHRSYIATPILQLFLILAGVSAVQGSCLWWARTHRAHHRHTDTDRDPYNATRGLLWSHIGWIVVESEFRPGPVDASDLASDPLLRWQHRWYFLLMLAFGYGLPTIMPGLLWGDWVGGFFYAGTVRLTVAHHSTFSINSIAHWLGSTTYDDKLSPRDHLLSALLTMGEGYHNFHHQFPADYRNAFRWYQYDPTKWFIAACAVLRLASHLRVFPANEVEKGALAMKLKALKDIQDTLDWPADARDLPVVSWQTFRQESKSRTIILVSGFIHDVSVFVDHHPGGARLLAQHSGKDATAAFFGGVYAHSNAAHNLLAMMRIGVLDSDVGHLGDDDDEDVHTQLQYDTISPGQKLFISVRRVPEPPDDRP